MTFDQIVQKVMDKLNLSSVDARDRIGERVNEIYRDVTSGIGLETSRDVEDTVILDSDVDTDLPYVTVDNVEKILTVRLHITGNKPKVLTELTHEDIKSSQNSDGIPSQDPQSWAPFRLGADSVTFILDAYPSDGNPFTLEYKGIQTVTDLSGSDVPAFPESFHDLLVEGAKVEELLKMEKAGLAQQAQQRYEKRVSDLRFFLAKSQWLDIVQGQLKRRHIRGSTVINDN
jgi:hypothetical protein